jgi:DNA polymerase elongation subunit (family B)
MIIDIENQGTQLRVSHFTPDGDLDFLNVPIPESERFVWEKCSPSNPNKDKEWKTWTGDSVRKVKTEKYDKYRIAQILEEAPKELTAPLWEFQNPKKYFVDIEVEITEDMGAALDTENAKNRVLSIGIATDKCKLIILGLDPLTQEQQVSIHNKVNEYLKKTGDEWSFKYKQFETEFDMMYTFFKELAPKMPLITGWNWMGYDWPYLINRARRLGIEPKIISPGGYLIGKNQLPVHLLMVDYLEIYKKWDRVIKIKESNRLDYVADKAIGLKKIEYNGTLRDLYQSNFEDFIYYNAVDCALVHYIDQKLKTMQTFFKIAQIAGVEINRSLSPVWSTEIMMLRKFLERKQVFTSEKKDEVHVKFAGGYVKEPTVGLHEWVACYDFASLYPNTMVQWNISPEAYHGKNSVNPDPTWIKTASGAYFGSDSEEPILKNLIKGLYAKRRKTKDRMLELQIEIDQLQKTLAKVKNY